MKGEREKREREREDMHRRSKSGKVSQQKFRNAHRYHYDVRRVSGCRQSGDRQAWSVLSSAVDVLAPSKSSVPNGRNKMARGTSNTPMVHSRVTGLTVHRKGYNVAMTSDNIHSSARKATLGSSRPVLRALQQQ